MRRVRPAPERRGQRPGESGPAGAGWTVETQDLCSGGVGAGRGSLRGCVTGHQVVDRLVLLPGAADLFSVKRLPPARRRVEPLLRTPPGQLLHHLDPHVRGDGLGVRRIDPSRRWRRTRRGPAAARVKAWVSPSSTSAARRLRAGAAPDGSSDCPRCVTAEVRVQKPPASPLTSSCSPQRARCTMSTLSSECGGLVARPLAGACGTARAAVRWVPRRGNRVTAASVASNRPAGPSTPSIDVPIHSASALNSRLEAVLAPGHQLGERVRRRHLHREARSSARPPPGVSRSPSRAVAAHAPHRDALAEPHPNLGRQRGADRRRVVAPLGRLHDRSSEGLWGPGASAFVSPRNTLRAAVAASARWSATTSGSRRRTDGRPPSTSMPRPGCWTGRSRPPT